MYVYRHPGIATYGEDSPVACMACAAPGELDLCPLPSGVVVLGTWL